jgi:hypothetical protein
LSIGLASGSKTKASASRPSFSTCSNSSLCSAPSTWPSALAAPIMTRTRASWNGCPSATGVAPGKKTGSACWISAGVATGAEAAF